MGKQHLVVIGNGMAGARAVEEILARGGADLFTITMFGDEPYGNYNRIMLSNVLNQTQDVDDIFLNPLEWYADNAITLHAGVRVTAIDRAAREVYADNGLSVPYDLLLIATGSRPLIPAIDGVWQENGTLRPGVFGFRSIADCAQIADYARKSQHVAVIGGGLLGLEAARGVQGYGCTIHVVHRSGHLMTQQLDAQAGGILRSVMETMGMHIHLRKATTAILADGDQVRGLAFSDGTMLPCDMVVISTGIQPNIELGLRAGLTVERGIVVDNQMRSVDDSRVYVVGECAQHRGQVYGLVAPLWEQARVLADHITGVRPDAAYHGSRTATKLKVMGVELAAMGLIDPEDERDEVVQFTEPKRGSYKKLIIRDGRLVGAMLLGDITKAPYLIQAFERGTPLPEERLSLLFDLGAPSQQATIESLPEDAQVCNCNGVSKGQIGACVLAGRRTIKAVMEATRAGMGCGSCKKQVGEVIEFYCEGQVEEDPSIHYYVPGVPLAKPALVEAIQTHRLTSVSSVFRVLAGGTEDAASKPGLASLLRTLWGAEYEDERDARFINDRVHANIQRDGTFSVVPPMPGGVTTPADLKKIAEVAERYNVPLVKLTGGQRIDLLGIKKDDLPRIWADLGMPSGHAYGKSFRTCKSCVGTDFCRYGVGDSLGLAQKIETWLRGLESPGKLKMATAGCPRNCSEAYVKDVGLVAIEGGKWEVYVGGAAGAHVRKGDLLCTVDTEPEALQVLGRFVQYYREQAKYLERTYGFVERVGIEKLRRIIVDDCDSIGERLDAALQASVDAYVDPWQEAARPRTANQFASVIPLVPVDQEGATA